jgi:hypothetical protein
MIDFNTEFEKWKSQQVEQGDTRSEAELLREWKDLMYLIDRENQWRKEKL